MSLSADTLERIVLNIGNHLLDPAPNMLFHGRQPLHAQAILSLAGANSEVRARILVSTEPSMHKKLSCKPCIPCIVCGLDCVTTCHACKKAFYCSQKCQAQHWPKHAGSCKKFRAKRCPYGFPSFQETP